MKSTNKKKYSKTAYLDAAKDSKEKLLLSALLKEGLSYSQDEVMRISKEWKSKEVI